MAGLALLIGSGGALAQSGTPAPQDQSAKPPAANAADANKDNQRKTDEFVEASQAINGPAGNPECVWLGRRVVQPDVAATTSIPRSGTSTCMTGSAAPAAMSRPPSAA